MSEAQKSAMGPRRLFILLALGAVVFYFLSSGDDITDPVEVLSETETVDNLDLGDDSITLKVEEESTHSISTKKNSVEKVPAPQTSKETDAYTPQSSSNTDDGYQPQSFGNNDGYTPQADQ